MKKFWCLFLIFCLVPLRAQETPTFSALVSADYHDAPRSASAALQSSVIWFVITAALFQAMLIATEDGENLRERFLRAYCLTNAVVRQKFYISLAIPCAISMLIGTYAYTSGK